MKKRKQENELIDTETKCTVVLPRNYCKKATNAQHCTALHNTQLQLDDENLLRRFDSPLWTISSIS